MGAGDTIDLHYPTTSEIASGTSNYENIRSHPGGSAACRTLQATQQIKFETSTALTKKIIYAI